MTTEATQTEPAAAPDAASQEQKPEKKANAAPQKPRVAPGKAKSGKKTTPAKKGAKSPKAAKAAKAQAKTQPTAGVAREGSKTAKILDLLKRPDGATLKEIMKATGWQPHSVRGFISGTLGKKLGLTVESAKSEDGDRVYSLKK